MDYDIALYEVFEEEEDLLRRLLPRDLAVYLSAATIQEAADPAPPAPLICPRTQSIIPPAWASRLAGILSRSAGYDHLEAYRKRARPGLPCGYLPEYCARAVAEQALLLWLALLRRLPRQVRCVERFQRDGLTGGECAGRTLAVFGVGRIGREIVRIGRGLDMQVLGVDIELRHPDVVYVEPAEALNRADVIACAMNLTEDNRGYFRRAAWELARPGALFVNIARGELAPTADLLAALDQGRLAGAGLDVFEGEAAAAGALRAGAGGEEAARAVQELARRPNVILTPHNAFNTREAVERKAEQTVRQIAHFRANGQFLWPIPGS